MAADTPLIRHPVAGLVLRLGSATADEVWHLVKTIYSGAGTQREVQWEIATDAGFTASVWTSGLRENDDLWIGDDWCEVYPQAIPLAAATLHYLRVKVRNTSGETSSWSTAVSFTTSAELTPTLLRQAA